MSRGTDPGADPVTTTTSRRWWVHASCAHHPEPELWTSGQPADKVRAIRVCRACPVRTVCRDESVTETYGVWGGVDRAQ